MNTSHLNAFFGPFKKENLYIMNTDTTNYVYMYETREEKREHSVLSEAVLGQLIIGQFMSRLFITRKFVACMEPKKQ